VNGVLRDVVAIGARRQRVEVISWRRVVDLPCSTVRGNCHADFGLRRCSIIRNVCRQTVTTTLVRFAHQKQRRRKLYSICRGRAINLFWLRKVQYGVPSEGAAHARQDCVAAGASGLRIASACNFPTDDGCDVGSKGLWVANGTNVVEYNPTQLSGGMSATAPHVSINSAAFGKPQGVAFDPNGNLWVLDPAGLVNGAATPALLEFSAAQLAALATDNAPEPVAIITSTFLKTPRQAVIDALGNAWLTDPASNMVMAYAARSWRRAAPTRSRRRCSSRPPNSTDRRELCSTAAVTCGSRTTEFPLRRRTHSGAARRLLRFRRRTYRRCPKRAPPRRSSFRM